MPKISLWNPVKRNDYKFVDGIVAENIYAGGTGVNIHKYLGVHDQGDTNDFTQPQQDNDYGSDGDQKTGETFIQDVLFLENRDRKYDDDIYELRGTYTVSDSDFDLTQFGMFLQNDTLFINFHIETMVSTIGRKLMAGDVIELPHLRDDLLLDERKDAINRFYVITDASRPSEGFDPNWWPHMWRCKLGPISDSQEYRDIIGYGDEEDDLRNVISTYQDEIDISDGVSIESASYMENSVNDSQVLDEGGKNIDANINTNNEEHYTPNLFADESHSKTENSIEENLETNSEKLFDQDINEEEDFEIPAFLRKQKF